MSTPKKTTAVTVALRVVLLMRAEASTHPTRYAILLTLADSRDEQDQPVRLTPGQIAEAMDEDIPLNSAILRIMESGLIQREGSVRRGFTYTLTAAGEAEAARIVRGQPNPKPTAAAGPNMTKVLAAAAAR